MASEYKKMLALQKMYETGQIPAHKAKRKALAEKIKKLDPRLKDKENPDKYLKPGSVFKEGGTTEYVISQSNPYVNPNVSSTDNPFVQKALEKHINEQRLGKSKEKRKKDKKNPDMYLKEGSIFKGGGKIPSVNAKDRVKKYR